MAPGPEALALPVVLETGAVFAPERWLSVGVVVVPRSQVRLPGEQVCPKRLGLLTLECPPSAPLTFPLLLFFLFTPKDRFAKSRHPHCREKAAQAASKRKAVARAHQLSEMRLRHLLLLSHSIVLRQLVPWQIATECPRHARPTRADSPTHPSLHAGLGAVRPHGQREERLAVSAQRRAHGLQRPGRKCVGCAQVMQNLLLKMYIVQTWYRFSV